MENTMNINLDNLEEAKELLEYALENRRWIEVEEALEILKESLGYEIGDSEEESE
jgi:hypothetical protein